MSTFENATSTMQNAHPGIDLGRAADRFFKLKANGGNKTSFTRRELKDALGFISDSGFATKVISALLHFGLLERVGTSYVYTDLGSNLLAVDPASQERARLLLESLTKPEMYRWLYNSYQGNIPNQAEATLVDMYSNRHVNKDNVKEIISNYRKSVAFFVNNSMHPSNEETVLGEDVEVSFLGTTMLITKRYLLEAIKKTNDDKLASLR